MSSSESRSSLSASPVKAKRRRSPDSPPPSDSGDERKTSRKLPLPPSRVPLNKKRRSPSESGSDSMSEEERRREWVSQKRRLEKGGRTTTRDEGPRKDDSAKESLRKGARQRDGDDGAGERKSRSEKRERDSRGAPADHSGAAHGRGRRDVRQEEDDRDEENSEEEEEERRNRSRRGKQEPKSDDEEVERGKQNRQQQGRGRGRDENDEWDRDEKRTERTRGRRFEEEREDDDDDEAKPRRLPYPSSRAPRAVRRGDRSASASPPPRPRVKKEQRDESGSESPFSPPRLPPPPPLVPRHGKASPDHASHAKLPVSPNGRVKQERRSMDSNEKRARWTRDDSGRRGGNADTEWGEGARGRGRQRDDRNSVESDDSRERRQRVRSRERGRGRDEEEDEEIREGAGSRGRLTSRDREVERSRNSDRDRGGRGRRRGSEEDNEAERDDGRERGRRDEDERERQHGRRELDSSKRNGEGRMGEARNLELDARRGEQVKREGEAGERKGEEKKEERKRKSKFSDMPGEVLPPPPPLPPSGALPGIAFLGAAPQGVVRGDTAHRSGEERGGERSRPKEGGRRRFDFGPAGQRGGNEAFAPHEALPPPPPPPVGDLVLHTGEAVPPTEDPSKPKAQPTFELSGKLAEETNKVRGIVLQFVEPPEARKPTTRWRLYVFKDADPLKEPLYIHRQTCYLFGRERRVVDIPTDHPSCSKQHAVLQYRLVEHIDKNNMTENVVKPYVMDLGSTNGTWLNGQRIEAHRYYELLEKDTLKFGNSSREYVMLHENSAG